MPLENTLMNAKAMPTSRRKIYVLAVLCLIFIAMIAGCFMMVSSAMNASSLQKALELARLHELPRSASRITLESRGGLFNGEYHVRFQAPLDEIEAWLRASPGTRNVEPSNMRGRRRYEIAFDEPGRSAHVIVDEGSKVVQITAIHE